MITNKPKNMREYEIWFKSICKSKDLFLLERTDYNDVAAIIKKDFEESKLWSQLIKNLGEYNDEYLKRNSGYGLLMYPREPELLIKPYGSFLLKTFRENVLENESWPKAPKNGWILPNNWFSKINDIVRTMFVVKYIDGVEFIKNKIDYLCKENNRKYIYSLKAKEEGYYAGHLHITEEIEIPEIPWGTKKVDVSIEIKITTQLKEVIQKLIHGYYEKKREEIKINKKNGVPWQWDYRSNEFNVNYLGHIIHYIEGVIINIREK
ncbi:MAG TPA: hypothetical protein VMZ91_13260 [Candidatus Paceibacterota bacterium]|nr:hypothetical protein [Candidatus Paceibacterota bacterium]